MSLSSAYGMQTPPVCERTPNAPYHLGRVIVNRFTELLFGEHRFPKVEVPNSHETEVFLNELAKSVQLKAHMIEAATLGGSQGSVVTMFKAVKGKFQLESFNSKWVTPEWEDYHSGEMYAFKVSYPYEDYAYDEQLKEWVLKLFLYTRIVTQEIDVTFFPQEAEWKYGFNAGVQLKDPKEQLRVNPDEAFYHGFGFVPAVFIQNLPRHDQIDGDSSFECAEELIERLSENLSAIHSALQGNLDPTLILKITPEDYKKLQLMGGVISTGSNGAAIVVGDKGDAKYIEIQCEGIKVAMEVIGMMRTYALELADCVIADPHRLTGAAQSAAAMKLLYAPMLSKCDMLRTQYGENGIRKLLGKMLSAYRLLTAVRTLEDGTQTQGKFKDLKYKDPKTQKLVVAKPDMDTDPDDMGLKWGDYFMATTADVFQAVEAAVMATGNKPVTTQKRAAAYVASFLEDPDLETTLAELVTEAAQTKKDEMELAKAGAATKAKAAVPKKAVAKKPAASQN
jgi:hypothetical protein